MPNNNTWNGIIAINGGDGKPSVLDERELYLDTNNKYLYAGFSNKSVDTVRVKLSDEAQKISKDWLNIDVSGNNPVFKVGNLNYDNTKNIFTATTDTYIFNKATLTQLNKLVLDTTMYGTTLPTKGEAGQVFFKIG